LFLFVCLGFFFWSEIVANENSKRASFPISFQLVGTEDYR
jgi:hypothetical protein